MTSTSPKSLAAAAAAAAALPGLTLLDLPYDVVEAICCHLDVVAVLRLLRTCRRFGLPSSVLLPDNSTAAPPTMACFSDRDRARLVAVANPLPYIRLPAGAGAAVARTPRSLRGATASLAGRIIAADSDLCATARHLLATAGCATTTSSSDIPIPTSSYATGTGPAAPTALARDMGCDPTDPRWLDLLKTNRDQAELRGLLAVFPQLPAGSVEAAALGPAAARQLGCSMLHLAVRAAQELPADLLGAIFAQWPPAAACRDHHGRLPLHWALSSRCQSPALVQLVLDMLSASPALATVAVTGGKSLSPLQLAVANRQTSVAVLEKLLELDPGGAAQPRPTCGRRPLVTALENELPQPLLLLLLAAYPEAAAQPDDAGYFPLHFALRYGAGCDQLVLRLLDLHPQALTAPTPNQRSPLVLAMLNGTFGSDVTDRLLRELELGRVIKN